MTTGLWISTTTTPVLRLVTAYVSSICVMYSYVCIACVCVQICISISPRYYFLEMFPNNVLPLPYRKHFKSIALTKISLWHFGMGIFNT